MEKTMVCKKCGIEKSLNDFSTYKSKNGNLLYNHKCKECIKIENKEYRKNNPDKVKKWRQKDYYTHTDNYKKLNKKYRENNKQKLKEYNKKYKEEHNDELLNYWKKYYREKNPHVIENENFKLENEKLEVKGLKKCKVCNQIKRLEEFYFRTDTKKYREECKECLKKKVYKYRQDNPDIVKETNKKSMKKNIEKIKERQKEYRDKNKKYLAEKSKQWRDNNQQHISEYKKKNHKHIIERTVNYQRERRKKEPFLRFKDTVRNLINKSFRRKEFTKNGHTEEILGCDFNSFYEHLLKTYKKNYGYDWDEKESVHIDHIIPLETAKTEEEVIKLCHYTNLQLLKEKDNLKKGSKLDYKLDTKKHS